jgi:hypothetical protein
MKQLLMNTHEGKYSARISFITNHVKIIDDRGDLQLTQPPHLSVGPVFLTLSFSTCSDVKGAEGMQQILNKSG